MRLMSVMLDLPGDIMDLNTLTKCLLGRAIRMTNAKVLHFYTILSFNTKLVFESL